MRLNNVQKSLSEFCVRKENTFFLSSIFFGIIVWLVFFFTTPFTINHNLSDKAIYFVVGCYFFLIFGYILFPNNIKIKPQLLSFATPNNQTCRTKILIFLIFTSFFFRYYDLFCIRELNIFENVNINKERASEAASFNLIFSLLSSFRVLYFVPLIFVINNRTHSKKLFYISVILFTLPILEAYLRGSRRVIFEAFFLLIFILILFKKLNIKSIKAIISITIALIFLGTYSLHVVKSRYQNSNEKLYSTVFESEYNDFVPPNNAAVEFIQSDKNSILSHLFFSQIHIGQYIVHGIYEMDFMMKSKPPHTYGKYNLFLTFKLLNKLGLTDANLAQLNNPTKRNTYITLFGDFFIDFGWYSFIIMFFYGSLQKLLFNSFEDNHAIKPIVVVMLFVNFFMLVVNFFRISFLLFIMVYFFLLVTKRIALSLYRLSNFQ